VGQPLTAGERLQHAQASECGEDFPQHQANGETGNLIVS